MEAHTEVRSRRPRGLLVNQGPTWDGRSCTVGFPLIREHLGGGSGDPLRCPFMVPIWARRRGGWLLFVVLLTACGPSTVAPSSATASATPSHFEFDAKVTVGPIEPWVTTMPIYVSFLSNHVAVQPTGSDSVRCNGVALRGQPSDLLGYHYEGKVARVQVGGVYECVYTREGVRAVVTVPVVPGPTILSPKAGASLARTANLTVTYLPGLSAGVSGEINQPQGAGGEFATSGTQSDTGTYSMPLPSHLKPGPGWIILYRQMVIAPSGTGFRSVKVIDNAASTAIQVQWV